MNDGDFRVEPLAEGVWAIDDPAGDSCYLIEGTDRALLIDTGLGTRPLTPLLRTLTDKPVELALTHAHIDHMYRAGEFATVYLHRDDLSAWRRPLGTLYAFGHLLYRLPPKPVRPKRFTTIDGATVLDPGSCPIRVIPAPGHTPGSVIYADECHRLLFTGDAFGSGEAAWMWLPGCMDVRAYRDSLRAMLPALAPYRDYRWLGGHRLQGAPYAHSPHSHPLTMRVPEDMAALCDDMLKGRDRGKAVRLLPLLRLRVYSHGHASMVQRRCKIR